MVSAPQSTSTEPVVLADQEGDVIRFASFDIFETLLVRRVGDPGAIFEQVGLRLKDQLPAGTSPREFQQLRVEAEHIAREQIDDEVNYDEIYTVFAQLSGWEVELVAQCKALELEQERFSLHRIERNIRLLEAERSRGRQVLYISDMYLPADFLLDLLQSTGIWREGERLFVSHTFRKSKHAGDLYPAVLAELGATPDQVIHYGNNGLADVSRAREQGLQAVALPQGNLTRREQLLERFAAQTHGFASLLAGASRSARLEVEAETEHLARLRDMSAEVFAPTMACFTLWALQQASLRGLKRLYWVSRDGYGPYLIANRLAEALNLPIESRYFYGSRKAWMAYALDAVDERALSWVLSKDFKLPGEPNTSLAACLRRLRLDFGQIKDLLEPAGFNASTAERPLQPAEKERLISLFTGPAFAERLQAINEPRRAIVLDYLRGEGLLDHQAWAFVDVGWSGRCQDALDALLSKIGSACPQGLYFGLMLKDYADVAAGKPKTAFLFDRRTPWRDRYHIHGSVPFMESFFSAPHGSVIDYRRTGDGSVEPVFEEGFDERYEAFGKPMVYKVIEHFGAALSQGLEGRLPVPDTLRPMVYEALRTLVYLPTRAEAEAWGQLPFDDGFAYNQSYVRRYAEPVSLSVGNVWKCIRKGGGYPAPFMMAWHDGCRALSSPRANRAYRLIEAGMRLGEREGKRGLFYARVLRNKLLRRVPGRG